MRNKITLPIILVAVAALFSSCAKVLLPTACRPLKDTICEVKLNMTLDSLKHQAADSGLIDISRAANDTIFDYQFIADNFPHQKEWFFHQLCDEQEAMIKATAPFDSLWKIGKLKFTRIIPPGNFNCNSTGGLDAALTCNWTKVYKVAFANGAHPDAIHIFSYNNGYGTGNDGISVTGVGNESLITAPWDCPYFARPPPSWGREQRITAHEMGHAFGLAHDFTTGNIMYMATNGGCALGNYFLPYQQQIILNYILNHIE